MGGHLLQGLPHLSSIFLAKQVGPLLLGAQGSSPRNGLGPLLCNMSDKWYILRPFQLFFGHEHGRSLLLVRTACGTMKKIKTQTNWKRIRVHSMTFKIGIALEQVKKIWISCHSCSTASAAEGKRKLDTKGK